MLHKNLIYQVGYAKNRKIIFFKKVVDWIMNWEYY